MIQFRGRVKVGNNHTEKGMEVIGYLYFSREKMEYIIISTGTAESGGVEGCSGLVEVHNVIEKETIAVSTGVKDKNGIDIYGDYTSGNGADMVLYQEKVYEVCWNEHMLTWVIDNEQGQISLKDCSDKCKVINKGKK